MNDHTQYDVAVVGGGLAGLATAILLGSRGYNVALLEKERYPVHRVCGEYISMESWDFLQSLDLPLSTLQLPRINKLQLTAPSGRIFFTKLPLGGFGISRYLLESLMVKRARMVGVYVMDATSVTNVQHDGMYQIAINSATAAERLLHAKICVGAFGKRSNLDVKWKRDFVSEKTSRLENFVGVKYHIECDWSEDVIGLHNFSNGYCGISRVEDGKHCLCYMTAAKNLKTCNGDIPLMERTILSANPHLKSIFSSARKQPGFPVTISQISFSKKTLVENEMLMLGDAAGMITPLCGNGMSIALHSAKIAANLMEKHLERKMSLAELQHQYVAAWEQQFGVRLKVGRFLQGFFGSTMLSNGFVSTFCAFPFLARPVIKMTHGAAF